MAMDLPVYYTTGTGAEYLGWPRSRLHDRAHVGLVRPQRFHNRFYYTKRQLYLYKKSGFNEWPDLIDSEIIMSTREAAEFLSELWQEPISNIKFLSYTKKYGVPEIHRAKQVYFYSRGSIRQFATLYRLIIKRREATKIQTRTNTKGVPVMDIEYKGRMVTVNVGYYHNPRNLALWFEDDRGPGTKASCNTEFELPEGIIGIKDWSENEGVLKTLIDAGVIGEPVGYTPSGFVEIALCPFLLDLPE